MTSLRHISGITSSQQGTRKNSRSGRPVGGPTCGRVSIPVSGPSGLVKARKAVDCIRTRVPGLVITPAQDERGQFSFTVGCNITHAPSGWRLTGTFHDCSTARTFAHLLAELLDWNSRELANPLALVAAVKGATRNAPELLVWIGSLNQWQDDGGVQTWKKAPKSPRPVRSTAQILADIDEVF